MKTAMWMVRSGSGGKLADEFIEKRVAAIGWDDLGDLKQFEDKAAIIAAIQRYWPSWSEGKVMNSASQLIRFRDEVATGDRVLTYDSSKRIYHVGTVNGPYRYSPNLVVNAHEVTWEGRIDRDDLPVSIKNVLGSTLTLFRVPEKVAGELERLSSGQPVAQVTVTEEEDEEQSLLERYRTEAFEIIKDRVNRLDWEDMQELVAGLLRAMGYKTRVSDPGPDRGVDIMASPDGFGFEAPRIMVEVKHRNQAIGSQDLRSFLDGRHKDDKGLYVSTGGFSRDARYEADRANIPVMLMDIDDLVKAIFRNYEKMDLDTQKLLPLKKIYWPA